MTNKNIIIFFPFFVASCYPTINNPETCDSLYKVGKKGESISCIKKYLKKNPNDIKAMNLFVDWAESQKDLDEILFYIKKKYPELNNNVDYLIVAGDILMKQKDYLRATTLYGIGRMKDSTHKYINYKIANAELKFNKSLNRLNKEKVTEILYYINEELKYNPSHSASKILKANCINWLQTYSTP